MQLGYGNLEKIVEDYIEYTANFITPETDVIPPKINNAVISEDKRFVRVDWMLNEDCPAFIRRYELVIFCDVDEAIMSGTLSFDCRSGIQGPILNGTVPSKCKGEEIYIKVGGHLIRFLITIVYQAYSESCSY